MFIPAKESCEEKRWSESGTCWWENIWKYSWEEKQIENEDRENINDLILKAFEKDVDEHFSVSNESQKCSRWIFITQSMGLLRMHEKNSHKVYNNFEKIIHGFKFEVLKRNV